jgi:hypothetical protein
MTQYKVVSPIQHDGEVFVPGEDFSGDDEVVQALVNAGALRAEEEVEELKEPPPNYRDADLRLGSGDPSAPGAFNPMIDLPTPTNVPQAGEVDRMPIVSVAPQSEVFRKMAARAKEEAGKADQPTLDEMKEARDEEQQAGTDAGLGAQKGGVQDLDQVEQAEAREPGPVPTSAELPPESQATGTPADVKARRGR